ncbi:hypothetical protein Hanom_Chr00s000001g01596401 [Helianthus anomalus]
MSLTDLENWVQETGKEYVYVIVTRRSKNIGGTTGMVWLVCVTILNKTYTLDYFSDTLKYIKVSQNVLKIYPVCENRARNIT